MSCRNERKHKNVTYHDESGFGQVKSNQSTLFQAVAKIGLSDENPLLEKSQTSDSAKMLSKEEIIAISLFFKPRKTFDKGNWKEEKICAGCCRPFTWRKKWERCWETVYTCSDKCKRDFREGVNGSNENNDVKKSSPKKVQPEKFNPQARVETQPGTAGDQYSYPTGNIWNVAHRGDVKAVKNLIFYGTMNSILKTLSRKNPSKDSSIPDHMEDENGIPIGVKNYETRKQLDVIEKEEVDTISNIESPTESPKIIQDWEEESTTDDSTILVKDRDSGKMKAYKRRSSSSSNNSDIFKIAESNIINEDDVAHLDDDFGFSVQQAKANKDQGERIIDKETGTTKYLPIPPALKNKVGWTPLHAASAGGRDKVVDFLLSKAVLNIENNEEVEKSDVFPPNSYSVDINAADNAGRTPLFEAVRNGHLSVVKMLVKKGADIERTCKKNQIVLHYCKDKAVRDYLSSLFEQKGKKKSSEPVAEINDKKGNSKKKKKGGRNCDEFDPNER